MNIDEKVQRELYEEEGIKSFERDLYTALGIESHPKREALFELVNELGKDSGYDDKLEWARMFVKLMK